jgi:MFS family permease
VSDVVSLLRFESRARLFFLALAQSALGTGAAYVALLLVAYERFHSPWAISLILLADLLPAMVLGPVLGAVADRWSRKWCAVGGDVLRAGAFVGIAIVDGFPATLVLAVVAGAGTALFTPAALAGLPSLVHSERVPAATSLYGAITDLGFTAGPGLAAAFLLLVGPSDILLVNGVTFAASAVILCPLRFGATALDAGRPQGRILFSLLREARAGLDVVARIQTVRVVIAGSTAALFFGGMFNVGELPFATDDLGTSEAGYSVLVALFGIGFVVGSLAGSSGGASEKLRRRFLQGSLLMGLGSLLSGLAPALAAALFTFALAGFGNGLLLVHERLIVQDDVPDKIRGRAFGVKDALASWAFGVAFFAAGALLTLVSPRVLLTAAGVGGLFVCAGSALALSPGHRRGGRLRSLARRRRAASDMGVDEHRADVIDGREDGLAVLDHVD